MLIKKNPMKNPICLVNEKHVFSCQIPSTGNPIKKIPLMKNRMRNHLKNHSYNPKVDDEIPQLIS